MTFLTGVSSLCNTLTAMVHPERSLDNLSVAAGCFSEAEHYRWGTKYSYSADCSVGKKNSVCAASEPVRQWFDSWLVSRSPLLSASSRLAGP